MRLHFNPNQKYQLDAIEAVLRVFKGQPPGSGSNAFHSSNPGEMLAETGFANRLQIDEKQILQNVQDILKEERQKEEQEKGEQEQLKEEHGTWTISEALDGMHFSVEM